MSKTLECLEGRIGPETLSAFASKAEASVSPADIALCGWRFGPLLCGRSCARLYLALQGMSVSVPETTTGMDLHRLGWWLKAMAEHASGLWRGNQEGLKAIAVVHLEIWEEAQAATSVREETALRHRARHRAEAEQ